MNLRKREKIAPIHMMPGDSILLSYTDENGHTHEVLQDNITRHMTVDDVAIFDLDEDELRRYGLNDGIGGWFGESA